MAELLEVYNLNGKLIKIEDRKKFYSEIEKEFEKKGKISKKVKTIKLLFINSKGSIYLQKRSKIKRQNKGLYDKSVGSHVKPDEDANVTVTRECAEELGFPITVIPEDKFEELISRIDLKVIGIFKKIDYIENFKSIRKIGRSKLFIQPQRATFYIGYYDGAIRFVDGESSGIEVFSLKELKDEIKNNPNKFTEDIKFMIKKYERFLKPIK